MGLIIEVGEVSNRFGTTIDGLKLGSDGFGCMVPIVQLSTSLITIVHSSVTSRLSGLVDQV